MDKPPIFFLNIYEFEKYKHGLVKVNAKIESNIESFEIAVAVSQELGFHIKDWFDHVVDEYQRDILKSIFIMSLSGENKPVMDKDNNEINKDLKRHGL